MTVYAGLVLDGLGSLADGNAIAASGLHGDSDDGRYYYDVMMMICRVVLSVSVVLIMDRHEDFPPNRPPEREANQDLPQKFGLVPFNNCEWYGLYRGIILKDTKRNNKRNSSLLCISAMNSYRVGLSSFGKIGNILNNREN